jgi:hypothetical protein
MSSSTYFFAKPPEEADVVSNERDAWVTFDDTDFVFGRGDVPDEFNKVSIPPELDENKVTFLVKLNQRVC